MIPKEKAFENVKRGAHRCSALKIDKKQYKKSIYNADYSEQELNMIWDFYVTHSLSGDSNLSRTVSEYGWPRNNTKRLEQALLDEANMGQFWLIKSKNIDQALEVAGLKDDEICIQHPRSVLKQHCDIDVDLYEEVKFSKEEPRIKTIFKHIRNSLAHGCTYFFDNQNLLLEDKRGNNITAEILISQRTLLDWIFVVDKDERFYSRKMLEDEGNGSIDC